MTDKQRKPIFFTSDLHIGHKNVIAFDNRPFTDLDHMHRVLINNYNAIVPENGVCYFLGDVGLCNSAFVGSIISQLNGTKILIKGNHDGGANKMYSLGFDAVLWGAQMVIAGCRVTMSHCPLTGVYMEDVTGMRGAREGDNWHGEWKHRNLSFADEGQFHLSGHIHQPAERRITGKQFCVAVTANNYRPVSISTIESWIARYNKEKAGGINMLGKASDVFTEEQVEILHKLPDLKNTSFKKN